MSEMSVVVFDNNKQWDPIQNIMQQLNKHPCSVFVADNVLKPNSDNVRTSWLLTQILSDMMNGNTSYFEASKNFPTAVHNDWQNYWGITQGNNLSAFGKRLEGGVSHVYFFGLSYITLAQTAKNMPKNQTREFLIMTNPTELDPLLKAANHCYSKNECKIENTCLADISKIKLQQMMFEIDDPNVHSLKRIVWDDWCEDKFNIGESDSNVSKGCVVIMGAIFEGLRAKKTVAVSYRSPDGELLTAEHPKLCPVIKPCIFIVMQR